MPASGSTAEDPLPGNCDTTLGRVVSAAAAVVNTLAKSCSATPDRSVTSFVTITATTLAGGRLAVNVTVRLSNERDTDGLTTLPLTNNTNELLLTVFGFSDSENVSTIGVVMPISTDLSFGVIDNTAGAVLSVAVPVVKLVKLLAALPARSRIPLSDT